MVENIILISKQKQILTEYTYSDDITLAYDYIQTLKEVAVDTENSGLDPHQGYEYCFQIGDSNKQFIIDCLTFSYKDIKPLLNHKDKLYILQNAKYDLQWFYKHNIILEAKIWDTYLAELRLMNGIKGTRKNLQALEEKYLGTDYVDKSKRKDIHTIPKLGYTSRVLKYSAGDIMVLPGIKQEQLKEAEEKELVKIIQLECEFVKVLAYSEYCGIYLDKDKWTKIAEANEIKLENYQKELNEWIITNNSSLPVLNKFIDTQLNLFSNEGPSVIINWNSPKQLIILFESLGINCTVFIKGKVKKSVEAKILKKQKEKSSLIPIYLKYATVQKEVSTYGKSFLNFINPKTGRIHPSYFQVLASGRLSSGGDEQSEDADTANIMVIPREGGYRACFTAQDPINDILINYDYSQMEDVVFANQSKVPALITLLKDGLDGHSYTAKIAFKEELEGFTLEEVKKKRPDLRQKAKGVKFAINFGGSDYTISNTLGLSKEEGTEIYNNYFNGFPGLGDYFDLAEKNAIKRGYILIDSLTGSKYYIDKIDEFKKLHEELSFDNRNYWDRYKKEKSIKSEWFLQEKERVSYYFRWKGAIRRHALNLPCQGTSSNITKIAAIYTFNEIIKRGWFNKAKIVLFLHDEIGGESSKTIAKDFGDLLYNSMIKAGKIYCIDVPLGASGGVTEVWEH